MDHIRWRCVCLRLSSILAVFFFYLVYVCLCKSLFNMDATLIAVHIAILDGLSLSLFRLVSFSVIKYVFVKIHGMDSVLFAGFI